MGKYFFLLSVFFLTACVNTEYNVGTHKQDLMFYSTEKEMGLGANVAKQVEKEYPLSHDSKALERINRIGNKVVQACDRKEINYSFNLIEKDEKNAFCLPGGYVYIFRGLYDQVNDDQLAFIFAHEIGHCVSRHGIKRLQAAIGYNLLTVAAVMVPNKDSNVAQGTAFALEQIMAGYSREDEFKADELGVLYCKRAGFDPKSGFKVLDMLYSESKKNIYPISYFRSHPYIGQRVSNVKTCLRMPLKVEDYINL